MSTSDGFVWFFRDNFFSDNFFFKVLQRKEEDKNYAKKKDRSPFSFRRKQSLIDLANLSSKETFLVRAVHTLVLALMTQEVMRST